MVDIMPISLPRLALGVIGILVAFSAVKILALLGYFGSLQEGFAIGEVIFAVLLVGVVTQALMMYGQLRKRALIEMSKAWIYLIGMSLIATAATAVGFTFLFLGEILREYFVHLLSLVDWMYFLAFVLMLYGLNHQYKLMKTHAQTKAFFTDISTGPGKAEPAQGNPFAKWFGDDLPKLRVIPIIVSGSIPISVLINKMVSALKGSYSPILMLGPTTPSQLPISGMKALWVTDIEEKLENVITAPPKALTEISIFITGATKVSEEAKPILLGDFLDSILPQTSLNTLNSFYSVVVGKFKTAGKTAFIFLQDGLHEEAKITLVKRFADSLVEIRESEVKGKRVEEIKVSNFVSRVYKDWEALRPDDIFSSR